MTSYLVSINTLVVRIIFAENYYLRVWLEKALSLDFIKGNQTVPFNRARLLSLRATYTLSAMYDQDCDASYYASSNIVSSYWLTFWESEKTEQTDYFRSLAIKKTVRSNNTNSCTDQIQGPRKTVHI